MVSELSSWFQDWLVLGSTFLGLAWSLISFRLVWLTSFKLLVRGIGSRVEGKELGQGLGPWLVLVGRQEPWFHRTFQRRVPLGLFQGSRWD